MKKFILASLLLLGLIAQADAASCFWVGGTGTWAASDGTHWASGTGGTGGTCAATGGAPTNAADTATFDGSSGGGTVTVNGNFSITSITWGAFTGTLDWSANNNNFTWSNTWSGSGAGTRTINMGSGSFTGLVWTMTTVTGLTFNTNTSKIFINNTSNTVSGQNLFASGSLTYNELNLAASGTNGAVAFTGTPTIATLKVTAPVYLVFATGTTTITNPIAWTGTASTPIGLVGSPGATVTLATASGTPASTWTAVEGITFSGAAAWTFNNSFNLGNNRTAAGATVSINPPSGGGGGGFVGIIGGS